MNPTTVASIYETFEQTIIKSLAFDTMQLRQRAIPKAFEKTFSWIFQDAPPCSLEEGEKIEWPNFPSLASSQGCRRTVLGHRETGIRQIHADEFYPALHLSPGKSAYMGRGNPADYHKLLRLGHRDSSAKVV
jgi:hypothetical protein